MLNGITWRLYCAWMNGDLQAALLQEHAFDREWSTDEIRSAHDSHGMMTWGATDTAIAGAIRVKKGDGVYLITDEGKRCVVCPSSALVSIGSLLCGGLIFGVIPRKNS